ncbi:methyltransferase [Zooshikella ganghwensis]|uniref:Ribosomal RNA large subunit methyltransferase G n=1 Tax=Zooshikella ganghwensis TaxID=202772 RepID=A0A4P9VTH2_9GAMM|nr:methyltransferase [Zooshikella ganghwensis]RDH45542.1 50S rRNA methyltransferase [Zooshikella ganghwensis]
MMKTFSNAITDLQLTRYPISSKDTLQAWDAADEYLIEFIAQSAKSWQNPIILNDQWGALSLTLHQKHPTVISDSFLSHQGIIHNAQVNQIASADVSVLTPLSELSESYDLVILKVPKNNSLLIEQLTRLYPYLSPNTTFVSGGMIKHLPPTLIETLEQFIGPTQASLAQKKARLFHTEVNTGSAIKKSALSSYKFTFLNQTLTAYGHANVFARQKLDIGTRLLLQHLPSLALEKAQHIVDLGCGNGVLGVCASIINTDASISFTDESFMAVDSAKRTWQKRFPNRQNVQFIVNDCLQGITTEADEILCNPPFHQQHTVGDQIAWRMFKQAKQKLVTGGALTVIGNRHLNYHMKLKRLFGNCTLIANDRKFVILRATKSL